MADFVVPLADAETVTLVFDFTDVVPTLKVAEVLPAGIVTAEGAEANPELTDRATTRPPDGAAEVIVTVPVLDYPPTTLAGLNVNDLSVGAITVSVAVFEMPPSVAVKVTVEFASTALVLTGKLADVFPDGTVMVVATLSDFELMESLTSIPPDGAGPPSITVPVDDVPPATVAGFTVSD